MAPDGGPVRGRGREHGCLPWEYLLHSAFRLGWSPAEFWAATLYEIETAIWLRIKPDAAPAMTETEQREFFDRLEPSDAH